MKIALGAIALLVLGAVGYVMWTPANTSELGNVNQEQVSKNTSTTETTGKKAVVTDGAYTVNAEESTVSWAGKKRLLKDM